MALYRVEATSKQKVKGIIVTRQFIMIAGILGLLGVALGAFGSHGLAPVFEANGRASSFETGSRYHLYHTLALFGVGLLAHYAPSTWTRWAGILFIVGIVIFSGSLYILSIFDIAPMGAIAPIGGTALILGWACLAVAGSKLRT